MPFGKCRPLQVIYFSSLNGRDYADFRQYNKSVKLKTMKKYLILLGIAMITVACSKKEEPQVEELPVEEFSREWEAIRAKYFTPCDAVANAFLHPEDWLPDYMIPAETISAMSTCELLSSYLNYLRRNTGPWCNLCSGDVAGVTFFNKDIWGYGYPSPFVTAIELEPAIVEFFSRDGNDCANALASTYLWLIDNTVREGEKSGREKCLELLIASDMSMAVLDENAKIEFMLMALKMIDKFPGQAKETRHIMVAVMKSENYTPFMTEAEQEKWEGPLMGVYKSGLTEFTGGYYICLHDVVEKYTRQYLTEKLERYENE
jgi:hypothetical protein